MRRYKDRLEVAGLIGMGVGILCMVQPVTLVLYGIGFPILLVALIFYIVVNHL
jgi:hypothetical protein